LIKDFASDICAFVRVVMFDSDIGMTMPEELTITRACFKDDNASQWKSGKFEPRPSETPEPIVT